MTIYIIEDNKYVYSLDSYTSSTNTYTITNMPDGEPHPGISGWAISAHTNMLAEHLQYIQEALLNKRNINFKAKNKEATLVKKILESNQKE